MHLSRCCCLPNQTDSAAQTSEAREPRACCDINMRAIKVYHARAADAIVAHADSLFVGFANLNATREYILMRINTRARHQSHIIT